MAEPRRELVWTNKYVLLKRYLLEHHLLPDKRKQKNRGLLNWWKYNQKRLKKGICPPEQQRLLEQLEALREQVAFSFWEKYDDSHTVVRFATSWSTTEEDLRALRELLSRL